MRLRGQEVVNVGRLPSRRPGGWRFAERRCRTSAFTIGAQPMRPAWAPAASRWWVG